MSAHTPERQADGYQPVKVHEGRRRTPTATDPAHVELADMGERGDLHALATGGLVQVPAGARRPDLPTELRLEDIPADPFNPPAGSRFTAPREVVEAVFEAADGANALVRLDRVEREIDQARRAVADVACEYVEAHATAGLVYQDFVARVQHMRALEAQRDRLIGAAEARAEARHG